ncbi:hypothetical protein NE237_022554 [Protea cynaroides]|uniref:Uncharacterized protein n=1 Tax=Protea cynaroides TaxID=273540 RepID=A0A9Q0K5D8_9MAGN|nr:hypothetical protein NE237_022554 [Protea cynaroides]
MHSIISFFIFFIYKNYTDLCAERKGGERERENHKNVEERCEEDGAVSAKKSVGDESSKEREHRCNPKPSVHVLRRRLSRLSQWPGQSTTPSTVSISGGRALLAVAVADSAIFPQLNIAARSTFFAPRTSTLTPVIIRHCAHIRWGKKTGNLLHFVYYLSSSDQE